MSGANPGLRFPSDDVPRFRLRLNPGYKPHLVPGCAFEKFHRLGKIALARDVESSLAAVTPQLRTGADVEQRLDRVAMAVACGPHQRSERMLVDRVGIDARLEQQEHDFRL